MENKKRTFSSRCVGNQGGGRRKKGEPMNRKKEERERGRERKPVGWPQSAAKAMY